MPEHAEQWAISTMSPHMSLTPYVDFNSTCHTRPSTQRVMHGLALQSIQECATRGFSTLQASCIYKQTHERKNHGQQMW